MRTALLLALAGLALAASLPGPAAGAAPSEEDASFDRKAGDVRVQTGQGAAVPADFPKDIPLYPDSTVLTSVAGAGKSRGAEGFALTLETADSAEKVLRYYRQRLEPHFRVLRDVDTGAGHMVTLANEDATRIVHLTVMNTSKRTTIQLVVGRK